MWESKAPPVDPRPLETGGALVILRLTPAEVEVLKPYGFPSFEAIHALVARLRDRETEP